MSSSFLSLHGFFLSWWTNSGDCRIFVRNKHDAQVMFANLKRQHPNIELHKVENGKLVKVA